MATAGTAQSAQPAPDFLGRRWPSVEGDVNDQRCNRGRGEGRLRGILETCTRRIVLLLRRLLAPQGTHDLIRCEIASQPKSTVVPRNVRFDTATSGRTQLRGRIVPGASAHATKLAGCLFVRASAGRQ